MQHLDGSAPASSDAGAVLGATRDATAPATRPRRLGRRFLLLGAAIAGLVLVAAVFGVATFLYPMLPRNVVMATGVAGTGYGDFGERYRQIMARQGVQLKVLATSGTFENLAMLRSGRSGVNVALVQNGLTNPQQSPELASLGTIAYVPLWIFYRGPEASREDLRHLRGIRLSVGPTDSSMRQLALELLARNGVDASNTELLPFTPAEAAAHLAAGDIDAAMMLADPEAPAIKQLLVAPDVHILSLTHAEAYVALYPFLTTVLMPAGYADLAHDLPPADVRLIAVKMSLLVRRDLQPAVQYLLLEAATQIHGGPGVFQKAGEFPAAEGTDVPLSADAGQFYKTGVPFLQRYLPLWLAVLVEQLAITVLPLAAIAYPLLRMLPAAYDWSVRRRIATLYGELKLLELSIENRRQERPAALSDLERLEHRVAHLRVPSSFAHLFYGLRQDINLVRERLLQAPERP
jgi:TRAP transporter TAXI family solute receptor